MQKKITNVKHRLEIYQSQWDKLNNLIWELKQQEFEIQDNEYEDDDGLHITKAWLFCDTDEYQSNLERLEQAQSKIELIIDSLESYQSLIEDKLQQNLNKYNKALTICL